MENGFVVVTSQVRGLAGLFIEMACGTAKANCRPRAVVLCVPNGTTVHRSNIKRRIKKLRRIGLLGAANGIRMRDWYGGRLQRQLALGDVRSICAAMAVPVMQISAFRDPTAQRMLADLRADVGISLGNGMIPEEFFQIPRFGMINIHHEVLPKYRGAQTAIWQIHDGSSQTGFSVHEVTRQLDRGRILVCESMPITFGRSLRETVTTTAAEVQRRSLVRLLDVVVDFESYRERAIPNEGGKLYTTPSARAMLRIYRNHSKLRQTQVVPRYMTREQ